MASVMIPAGLVKLMSQASGAVGVAARAGGLLTDHTVAQGDGLVLGAGVQTANPELGDDEVGALNGLGAVHRGVDLHVALGLGGHALGQRGDGVQLLLPHGDVHQPQLLDGQGVFTVKQALQKLGGIAAATADDSHFQRGLFHSAPSFSKICAAMMSAPWGASSWGGTIRTWGIRRARVSTKAFR